MFLYWLGGKLAPRPSKSPRNGDHPTVPPPSWPRPWLRRPLRRSPLRPIRRLIKQLQLSSGPTRRHGPRFNKSNGALIITDGP